MDLIAEYLRRQRAVFDTLLAAAGRTAQAQPTEDRAEKTRRSAGTGLTQADASARSPSPGSRAASAKAGTKTGTARRADARRSVRPDSRRKGAALREDAGAHFRADAPEEGEILRRDLSRRSAERRQAFSRTADAGREEASPTPGAFRTSELRARELSFAVERDARRYDGGFSTL